MKVECESLFSRESRPKHSDILPPNDLIEASSQTHCERGENQRINATIGFGDRAERFELSRSRIYSPHYGRKSAYRSLDVQDANFAVANVTTVVLKKPSANKSLKQLPLTGSVCLGAPKKARAWTERLRMIPGLVVLRLGSWRPHKLYPDRK